MFPSEVLAEYVVELPSGNEFGDELDDFIAGAGELDATRRKTPATLLTSQCVIDLFAACKRILERVPLAFLSRSQPRKARSDMLNVIRWMVDSNAVRNGTLLFEILDLLAGLIPIENEDNAITACRIISDLVRSHRSHIFRRNSLEKNSQGYMFVSGCVDTITSVLGQFAQNCIRGILLHRLIEDFGVFNFRVMLDWCPFAFEFSVRSGGTCAFLPKAERSLKLSEELFVLLCSFAEMCPEAVKEKGELLMPVLVSIVRMDTTSLDSICSSCLETVGESPLITRKQALPFNAFWYSRMDLLVDVAQVKLKCLMFTSFVMRSLNLPSISTDEQHRTLQLVHSESVRLLSAGCPGVGSGPLLHSQISRILRRVVFWQGQSPAEMFELLLSQVLVDDEGIMHIGRSYFAITSTRTTAVTVLADIIKSTKRFYGRKELLQFMRVISIHILDYTLTWRAQFAFLSLLLALSDQFKVLVVNCASTLGGAQDAERSAGLVFGRQRIMFGRLIELLHFRLNSLCRSARRPIQLSLTEKPEISTLMAVLRTSERRRTNYKEYMNIQFKIDLAEARSIAELIFQIIHLTSESLLRSTFFPANECNQQTKLNDLNAFELKLFNDILLNMIDGLHCFARTDMYDGVFVSAEFDDLGREISDSSFQLRPTKETPKQSSSSSKSTRAPSEVSSTRQSDSGNIPHQQHKSLANQCLLHSFRDTLTPISESYFKVIAVKIVPVLLSRQYHRIDPRTEGLNASDHLTLHLFQTLLEVKELVRVFASEIIVHLCKDRDWGEWEVSVVLQVFRSLNRVPDLDRRIFQLVLEHNIDNIFNSLMYAQLKSCMAPTYALIWLEIFRASSSSTRYDWFNDTIMKRLSKLLDFLNLVGSGKHRAEYRSLLTYVCLMASSCYPNQLSSIMPHLIVPIVDAFVSRRHSQLVIRTFEQILDSPTSDVFESACVRVEPSFIHVLTNAAYSSASNEVSRSILLCLARLSGNTRRSNFTHGAPSNLVSVRSEHRQRCRRQRLYGEGWLLTVDLLIDDTRKGKLLLPAQQLIHDCIRVLDAEEAESESEMRFLATQAYRIVKCYMLYIIDEDAGSITSNELRCRFFACAPESNEQALSMKTDVVFALLVACECKWLWAEWKRDANQLCRSVQKFIVLAALRTNEGGDPTAHLSIILSAICKGLSCENSLTNQSALNTFETITEIIVDHSAQAVAGAVSTLINKMASTMLKLMYTDGEWISRLHALRGLRFLLTRLSGSPFTFNPGVVLDTLDACASVPAALHDDSDFGTVQYSFEVLQLILAEFMGASYVSECPEFACCATRTLMNLCINPSKPCREYTYALLSRFIEQNSHKLVGDHGEYLADIHLTAEHIVKASLGFLPGNTHCSHVHGLSLLSQIRPPLLKLSIPLKNELLRKLTGFVDRGLPPAAWSNVKLRVIPGQSTKWLKLSSVNLIGSMFPVEALDVVTSILTTGDQDEKRHAADVMAKLSVVGYVISVDKSVRLFKHLSSDSTAPPKVFSLLPGIPDNLRIDLIRAKTSMCINHIRAVCMKLQDPGEVFVSNMNVEDTIHHAFEVLNNLGECPSAVISDIVSTINTNIIIIRLSERIRRSVLQLLGKHIAVAMGFLVSEETICRPYYVDIFIELIEYSEHVRWYLSSDPMIVLKIMQILCRRTDGTINRIPALKLGTVVTYTLAQYPEHQDWFMRSKCLLRNFDIVWTHNTAGTREWCTGSYVINASAEEPKAVSWTSFSNLSCTSQLCWIILRIIRNLPNENLNLLISVFERCFDNFNYYSCGEIIDDFLTNVLPTFTIEWKHMLFERILQVPDDSSLELSKRFRRANSAILAGLYPCLKSFCMDGSTMSETEQTTLFGRAGDQSSLVSLFCRQYLMWLNSDEMRRTCFEMVDYYNLQMQCLRLISLFCSDLVCSQHITAAAASNNFEVMYDFSISRLTSCSQHTDPIDLYESQCALANLIALKPAEHVEVAVSIFSRIVCERTIRSIALYDHEAIRVLIRRVFPKIDFDEYAVAVATATSDCLLRGVQSALHKQRVLALIVRYPLFFFFSKMGSLVVTSVLSAVTEIAAQSNPSSESMTLVADLMSTVVDWEENAEYMHDIVTDYFCLTLLRLLSALKSVKDYDCFSIAENVKEVMAKCCRLGLSDNVIHRSNDLIFASLLAVPEDANPHQLRVLSVIIDCILSMWTLSKLIDFAQLDYAITCLLRQAPASVLIEPRTRMLANLAVQRMSTALGAAATPAADTMSGSRLYKFLFEEVVVSGLWKPGALLEEDNDQMVRTIQCFDLVCSFAMETSELNLVLAYAPPDELSKRLRKMDHDACGGGSGGATKPPPPPPPPEAGGGGGNQLTVNIIELCVQFLTLVTREYFGSSSTHSKQVLAYCLSVGIVSVRPYAACLIPDSRKSLLCSVILPAIDKITDPSFQMILADTVRMWTSGELEYGDYQMLAREKMALIVRFIKAIDRNKISDPLVLAAFFASADGLVSTGIPKDSELARRIEDVILSGLKEPIVFSQVFRHLSCRSVRTVYQRLVWMHSLLHWIGAGATTSWTGFAFKLLLECVHNDIPFEIVDLSKMTVRANSRDMYGSSSHKRFHVFAASSTCRESDDDIRLLNSAVAAAAMDSYELVDAIGNFVSSQHPIAKQLAHDLWVFCFQQLVRKLDDEQRKEMNKRWSSFILNEDHVGQVTARPITPMQTFMEGIFPVVVDGSVELSSAAIQFAAKCYGSFFESLLLLEQRLKSTAVDEPRLLALPSSVVNSSTTVEDHLLEEEEQQQLLLLDTRSIHSYFEKMFLVNGLDAVCRVVGEDRHMLNLYFESCNNDDRALRDAILLDSIGDYASALVLYANAVDELQQQQQQQGSTAASKTLSDEQGLRLFRTKYSHERFVNCLRELGDWDALAAHLNNNATAAAAADPTTTTNVELALDASWRTRPIDFETIRAKFPYFEQMEPKRNQWLLSFYKALAFFSSSDFDISSVIRTVSDGISALTVDFLCLPNNNNNNAAALTDEHFRTLNRIQRFVEMKESMELCKILKAEGRNASCSEPPSTTTFQLQMAALNRCWDGRVLSLKDSFCDWDALFNWRMIFLAQICPQTPTKRNMGVDKVVKSAPLKMVQLCRVLRKTGAPLQCFEKLCSVEDNFDAIPVTISLMSACGHQLVKSLIDLSPYLQSPYDDLQPGMDSLRELDDDDEDEWGGGGGGGVGVPPPCANELFQATWINGFSNSRLQELVNEHQNSTADPANDTTSSSHLAPMAADKLQMSLLDRSVSCEDVGAIYRRVTKLQHNNARAHFLFANSLIDDIAAAAAAAATAEQQEQKSIAEVERVLLFALNAAPFLMHKFEKIQVLAERISFLLAYDETSEWAAGGGDSLIDRLYHYLLEVKDSRAFVESRTFWMLVFPKLVALLFRRRAPPANNEEADSLVGCLLVLASRFPSFALRVLSDEQTDAAFEPAAAFIRKRVVALHPFHAFGTIRFDDHLSAAAAAAAAAATDQVLLDRICAVCHLALEKCLRTLDGGGASTGETIVAECVAELSPPAVVGEAGAAAALVDDLNRRFAAGGGGSGDKSPAAIAQFMLDRIEWVKRAAASASAAKVSYVVSEASLLNGLIRMPGWSSSLAEQRTIPMCHLVRISSVLPTTTCVVLPHQGRVLRRIQFRGTNGKIYSYLLNSGKPVTCTAYNNLIRWFDQRLVRTCASRRLDMRVFAPNLNSHRISHDLSIVEDFTVWRESPTCPLQTARCGSSILSVASAGGADYRLRALQRVGPAAVASFSQSLRDWMFDSLSPADFFLARKQLTVQTAVVSVFQFLLNWKPLSASEFEVVEVARSASSELLPNQFCIPLPVMRADCPHDQCNFHPIAHPVPFRLTPMVRELLALSSSPDDEHSSTDDIPGSPAVFAAMVAAAKCVALKQNKLEYFLFDPIYAAYRAELSRVTESAAEFMDEQGAGRARLERAAAEVARIVNRAWELQKTTSVSSRYTASPLYHLMIDAVTPRKLNAMNAAWFPEL